MLLFCLYRPVSLYIWFVAGCMFKLYHCCSLYSLLIFLFVYTGWNGTKPVCFSEEIFSKLHRSCLAVLKAEPWTVCTRCWILPRAGWHFGQCLPAALRGLTPCAAGRAQEWAGQWGNHSALLPLQEKSGAQLDPPFLPSAQGFEPIEVITMQSCWWFVCCRILF